MNKIKTVKEFNKKNELIELTVKDAEEFLSAFFNAIPWAPHIDKVTMINNVKKSNSFFILTNQENKDYYKYMVCRFKIKVSHNTVTIRSKLYIHSFLMLPQLLAFFILFSLIGGYYLSLKSNIQIGLISSLVMFVALILPIPISTMYKITDKEYEMIEECKSIIDKAFELSK